MPNETKPPTDIRAIIMSSLNNPETTNRAAKEATSIDTAIDDLFKKREYNEVKNLFKSSGGNLYSLAYMGVLKRRHPDIFVSDNGWAYNQLLDYVVMGRTSLGAEIIDSIKSKLGPIGEEVVNEYLKLKEYDPDSHRAKKNSRKSETIDGVPKLQATKPPTRLYLNSKEDFDRMLKEIENPNYRDIPNRDEYEDIASYKFPSGLRGFIDKNKGMPLIVYYRQHRADVDRYPPGFNEGLNIVTIINPNSVKRKGEDHSLIFEGGHLLASEIDSIYLVQDGRRGIQIFGGKGVLQQAWQNHQHPRKTANYLNQNASV